MSSKLHDLYSVVKPLAIVEGANQTPIPYLMIYRYTQKNIVIPDTPNPFIYFVVDGEMRLHGSTGIVDYTPGQFFVSAFYNPISAETLVTSPASPFLALSIEFRVDDVVAVMLDIDGDLPERLFDDENSTSDQSHNSPLLLDAITRLVGMSARSDELSFMMKHIKREIIFDVIVGPYGKQLLQSIVKIQQTGDIYYMNSWIKQNYKDTFSVEELAEQSNMSVSSFHQKFKKAVGMGPLQCQKNLRLVEARRLMLVEAKNVTETALEVGYESLSQFIRDYRRTYGRTPNKDIQEIRECLNGKMQSD